jgi:hypothetical protein
MKESVSLVWANSVPGFLGKTIRTRTCPSDCASNPLVTVVSVRGGAAVRDTGTKPPTTFALTACVAWIAAHWSAWNEAAWGTKRTLLFGVTPCI